MKCSLAVSLAAAAATGVCQTAGPAAVAPDSTLSNSPTGYSEGIVGDGLIGDHFGLPFFDGLFDYVIVGGGTAGLVMAERLAANATNTVAVIEAGGFYEMDNGNLSSIPGGAGYWVGAAPSERNPGIDWEIYTEPDAGFGNRSFLYTQGKTFGGGSARNYLVYQRGTKQSYQKWADEVGDQSYTFDNLLPFFQKSVTFEPPNNNIRPLNSTPGYDAASFGNTGGPLHVSFPNWSNAVSTWIIKALTELGLSPVKGFTSGSLLGFQYATQTLNRNKQTRDSSQTSFLRKALAETRNLAVYERTLAKKINFDANNRATGVVIEKYGVRSTLYAKKEVILSAGAFRSPQMLMVSGVGPAATLQKLNIPVVADRPGVGQNMWDHVLFGPAYQVNLVTHSSLSNNPAFYGQQIVNYNTNRTGMLTNTASEFLGWEKLPAKYRKNLTQATLDGLATFPADWPEIELIFLDAWAGLEQDFLTGAPQDNNQYASVSCGIITPFSRGSVTINSTDTSDNPVVSPNLLSDPRDQDIAVQAFKRAREIIATKSLAPIRITQESFPGLNVSTDAQILDLIKQSALTIYHASATNKMGKVTDPMAVVDSHARVIGVQGLRVVDISAFPFLVPGHPQASVYMLAEKIADLINSGQ